MKFFGLQQQQWIICPTKPFKHSLFCSSQIHESLGLSRSRGQEHNKVMVRVAAVIPEKESVEKLSILNSKDDRAST